MRRGVVLLLGLSLACLPGCGGSGSSAGVVNISGSTSMELVAGALTEAYHLEHGDVTVNFSGSGSSAGIQNVLEGLCDIGLSSRALTARELEQGALAQVAALDGIAVIVHPDNPVEDLTEEQLAALAVGEITNWSQLGGRDAPVALIGREAGSGTRSAFEESLGVSGRCAYTNELTSSGDVSINVASNPNALGYTSLAAAVDSVKVLKISGITPGEDTVQDGSYVIQRPFLMVTRAGDPLPEAAQGFLDYALSARAAPFIRIAGAIPPGKADPS